jgi:membrane protein DedA with SNARE-associated domain
MPHTFVHETANNRVKRLVALLVMILLVVSALVVAAVNYGRIQGKPSSESLLSRYTPDVVHDITPFKQFILSMVSGIAFIPIPAPVEITFYVGLKQGEPLLLSMGATLLGYVIGSAISYLLGWKLSKQVVYLLSTRKIYAIHRQVNKYGVWAIILANLIPFMPGDLLSFSLGMTKYNAKRLFFFLTLSIIVNLSVIAALFYFVHWTPF